MIFKTLLGHFVDILYPHRCPSCKTIVDSDSVFCLDCWKKLQFITKPTCQFCGMPIQFNVSNDIICAKCLSKKPYYDKAISCFVYNKTISKAIFEFKFYQKTFLSNFFAKFMVNSIQCILNEIDYIVPVPISLKRLRWRGFNQALLLARSIGKLTNKEVIPDLIFKTRHTQAQVKLKNKERIRNLDSAFDINQKYINKIIDKNILIIDDVITTGTTINECSKIIKTTSINKIFVTSIAKTSELRKDHGDSYGI